MADRIQTLYTQNKDKPKKGNLPQDMMDEGRYLAANTVGDVWICYPWEATSVSSSFPFLSFSSSLLLSLRPLTELTI